MKEHGLAKIRDLKDYFLEQILEMLDKTQYTGSWMARHCYEAG